MPKPFRLIRPASRKSPFTPEDSAAVTQLLNSLPLPHSKELEVELSGSLPEGISLEDAHLVWRDHYLPKLETPILLPRQSESARCPKGLCRITILCINQRISGMGPFWGFSGYVLSLLVFLETRTIWDARAEAV